MCESRGVSVEKLGVWLTSSRKGLTEVGNELSTLVIDKDIEAQHFEAHVVHEVLRLSGTIIL